MMNKKGVMAGIAAILIILLMASLIFIKYLGATSGFHNGVVTAVEYNSNILFSATLVYFKTDAQSTQEDIYCVNDNDVKAKLIEASNSRARVTISYANDFLMFVWDCNGGESIINDVEVMG